MRQAYRSISDVLNSLWPELRPSPKGKVTDRVLRSSKLEDSIYADLRSGDGGLTQTEQAAAKKLRSFPALSRDIYQSFYSLLPKRSEDSALSVQARKFNAPILDHITQSEDFPTLKAVCEGRELPAYEAAAEFITQTASELDSLLDQIGGEKGALNTLEKLENAETQAEKELASLLERMRQCKERDEHLEQMVVAAANKTESKKQQAAAVGKMVNASAAKNHEAVSALVAQAVHAAAEKAEEVQSILTAWGDDPGNLAKTEVNTALLETVRKSTVLKDVAKYLGRFREIFAQGKRNFALIHFSGSQSCVTDIFRPGEYTVEDKMRAAETFLDGGTNFETPINAAMKLLESDFEKADIVFITDGECCLSDDYIRVLHEKQVSKGFTMTGILMDKAEPGMAFSLERFCQNVYRTSELLGDDIVRELVAKRV